MPVIGWKILATNKRLVFFFELDIRGSTGYGDEPTIVFRPWIRHDGSYVAAGETVSFNRPRLRDHSDIKLQITTDDGVSYTNSSANVIDNSTSTVASLNSLDTAANGDWVVIGGPQPFLGVAIDQVTLNSNTATLTVEYWNGSAWTAVSNMVDGTIASSVRTLGQDGQITWTIPTDWVVSTINGISSYWVRLSVSAALDSTTDIAECDLLYPLKVAVDVDCDGDDVTVMLEEYAGATGTIVVTGSSRVSWR